MQQKKKRKEKKRKSDKQLQNGGQKNQYPSRDIKFPTKNGKTTFPKNFSLKFGS